MTESALYSNRRVLCQKYINADLTVGAKGIDPSIITNRLMVILPNL